MNKMNLLIGLVAVAIWSGAAQAAMIQSVADNTLCISPYASYPLSKPMGSSIAILKPCDEFDPTMSWETAELGTNPQSVEVRMRLLSEGAAFCLQPYDGIPNVRVQLEVERCSGLQYQQWQTKYGESGGEFSLQLNELQLGAGGKELCMDMGGDRGKEGTNPKLSVCNGKSSQLFIMK